jgi:hypothetical protein
MKPSGLYLAMCLILAPACKHHASSYARPDDDPRDTDSLYALYHQILHDSDAVTIWSETVCEMSRLTDRLGPDVASRRIRAALDTVYTHAERRHRNEIDTKLWFHDYPLDNASCAADWHSEYRPDPEVDTTRKPPSPRPPPSR